MKKALMLVLLISMAASSGCGLIPTLEPTASPTVAVDTETPTPLPDPVIHVTSVPNSREATEAFLKAWENEDYIGMYNLLSQVSRDAISYDAFTERYTSTSINLTLDKLTTSITALLTNPTSAQVGYHTVYDTKVAGSFERDMEMNMVYEGGAKKELSF